MGMVRGMKNKILLSVAVVAVLSLGVFGATGCAVTSHAVSKATLGTSSRSSALEAALASGPGVVELESIESADWAVERSGLINLKNPTAVDAGLVDGDEPIQVSFHVIRHPTKGTFIVDTGVEVALRDAPEKSAMSSLVRSQMHMEKLQVKRPLGEWVRDEKRLDGVFLTHLHLDHVTGMADVPAGTPVFVGPNEARDAKVLYAFVQGSTDRALAGKSLVEWQFEPDADGAFDGVLDVFGDGMVWALWVPGHTPGSMAFLVRTPNGPVLLTGDASHTRWGWEHHVEPGTFTGDAPRGVKSFEKLLAFAAKHPGLDVRFGHQR